MVSKLFVIIKFVQFINRSLCAFITKKIINYYIPNNSEPAILKVREKRIISSSHSI